MEGDTFIQSYPWLQWNLFHTISPDTCYGNIIHYLKDKVVCAYCDGWMLLKEQNMCCLMNVHSSKEIRLPDITLNYTACILTCSPSDSSCRVLFIAQDSILYCQPGEKKYMSHNLEEGMCIYEGSVARLRGKVYYFTDYSENSLAVIDFVGSSLQLTKVEFPGLSYRSELRVASRYLVESDGQLLLVCKAYDLLCPQGEEMTELFSFLVFKFNFLNKMWMEIDNIGKSTVFLPEEEPYSHGVTFCATNPRIKQNSIYFLQRGDDYLHVYDLKDHSFSLLPNKPKTMIPCDHENSNRNMDYEEQNMKFLPQLPSHVSKLVLARIFTLDPGALGVIRSTCKDWVSIARPPTSEIDLRYNNFPYLVMLIDGTCKFFHPTYSHTFYLDTPELLGAHIKFSKFGWLLLSRYNREIDMTEYFFFNPLTKERINLPTESPNEFISMSFSSSPKSSNCFVVGVGINGCALAILRCGEDTWTDLQNFPFALRVVNYHPVFYKEKCYCFGANKELIVVDLNTQTILMVGEIFETELTELYGCFLAEDKEGLVGIFLLTKKKIPYLMRMDLSRAKLLWQPMESLGNKIIYVSHAGSWSNLVPMKSVANKIYFPLFQNSNSIFYSLSTKKYHSFLGNYSCSDIPFGVQQMTNCAWISVE